jgi:hypothetical protein
LIVVTAVIAVNTEKTEPLRTLRLRESPLCKALLYRRGMPFKRAKTTFSIRGFIFFALLKGMPLL